MKRNAHALRQSTCAFVSAAPVRLISANRISCFDEVDFTITPAIEGEVIRWDEIEDGSAAKFMRYSLPFTVLGWPVPKQRC